MVKKPSLDKEAMFQKIMPSAATVAAAPAPQPEGGGQDGQPLPRQAPPENAPLREGGVHLREAEQPMLVNVMEQLVAERLDAALAKFNCCRCDRCRRDAAAIALNKLPAKYVVAGSAQLQEYASAIPSAQVTTAVVQAVLQVRAHPRH